MGELIEFKKRKEPMNEVVQDIFAEMRVFTYKKLLPRGISQSIVDGFLADFEPILISMIPPPFMLLKIDESDPNYHAHMEVADQAQVQINDYVLKVIGTTFHRELRHFIAEQIRQAKGT